MTVCTEGNGFAGTYDGDATSGEVICTPYWSDTDDTKVTISGNTLTWSDDVFQKLTDTRRFVTAWQRSDQSKKTTVYFYNDDTYMIVSVSGGNTSVDRAGNYTGDTTKNGTISTDDWGASISDENPPDFTITGSVMKTAEGEEEFTKL